MKNIYFVGSTLTNISINNEINILGLVNKKQRKTLPKVVASLVVCKSQFGPYLDYYTTSEWERMSMIKPGFTLELDHPLHTTVPGNGILTLTDELVEYANLTTAKRQVIVTGQFNKGEIMSQTYYDDTKLSYEEALAIIDEIHGTNNLEQYLKTTQRRR